MPPDSMIYDLKGTLNSRRYVKPGDVNTLMDRNFIEDRRGLPIFLK